MARPARIEKLMHGRLLCGSVFRFFVETWNWLTSYVDNLKGDADVNPKNGYITVDRTDPDAPVIRLRADRLPKGGSGGGGVTPDGASTEFIPHDSSQGADNSDEGKLQVKGWKTGAPSGSGSIADDMSGSTTPTDKVIVRTSSGDLVYKSIGSLSGITGTVSVVTDVTWSGGNLKKTITELEFYHGLYVGPQGATTSDIDEAVDHTTLHPSI